MNDMFKLAMGVQADVYHAHEPDSFQVAVKLKESIGAKIIYDSHEYYPESFSEHFQIGKNVVKKCIYHYEKYLAKKADYIISVNNLLVNKFKKYNSNVALLPNYPVLSEKCSIKKYNKTSTFVYVGGLSEERGILNILKSIKLVKGKYRYIFVGPFWNEKFKSKVFNYIQDNLPNEDISFTGKIPHVEVLRYLENATAGFVLLQPSNWRYVNSEPIKLFEYMQNKVPVIASDFPMMHSIINAAECGVLVNPDNLQSISQAIDVIANDSKKVYDMGINGYNRVKKNYNWNNLEPTLLQIYKEVSNL